jgi:hypothetical protein
MIIDPQRAAYHAYVRSGKSPLPPNDVDDMLVDWTYRTTGANTGWVFWQAAQAAFWKDATTKPLHPEQRP